MSNKKRQKKYRGKDAAVNTPVVKRFTVDPDKPVWKIWLDDTKAKVRRWLILAVILTIIILIYSLLTR